MSQSIQYITNEVGSRVGVLLDIDTYQQLTAERQDPELLSNLSKEELTALAESKLSTDTQSQLDELLNRNKENHLSEVERSQLDQLLSRIDSLNILKTRARYTLAHLLSSQS
ncbi:MAG: hypothetical protein AAFV85_21685 [Cyanobacteria bacterium J06634_6]